MNTLRIPMLATVGLGIYTSKVYYESHMNQELYRTTHKYKLNFSPGSADEILLDSIKTGDIVMFSRRWYKYHVPQALYILAYQKLFNTEYDHIGICVCDKYGEPSILENTFWGGFKLRPFNERIVHSRSHTISIIMLNPRDAPEVEAGPAHRTGPRPARNKLAPTETRNEALRKEVSLAVQDGKKEQALGDVYGGAMAEVYSLIAGVRYAFGDMKKKGGQGHNTDSGSACYNIRLLQTVFERMGLTLLLRTRITNNKNNKSAGTHKECFTCRQLIEHSVHLQDNYDGIEKGSESKDVSGLGRGGKGRGGESNKSNDHEYDQDHDDDYDHDPKGNNPQTRFLSSKTILVRMN